MANFLAPTAFLGGSLGPDGVPARLPGSPRSAAEVGTQRGLPAVPVTGSTSQQALGASLPRSGSPSTAARV